MDGRSTRRRRGEAGRRVKVSIVDPSYSAKADIIGIISWTRDHFGPMQARKYADLLKEGIKSLKRGSDIAGVRKRDEIYPGLRSLRLHGGSHTLIFKVDEVRKGAIILMRVLHNSTDFARHIPEGKSKK